MGRLHFAKLETVHSAMNQEKILDLQKGSERNTTSQTRLSIVELWQDMDYFVLLLFSTSAVRLS